MAASSLQDQARELKANLPLIRKGDRAPEASRPLEIIMGFTKHAEGSVLVRTGDTHVICNASVEERVPPFRRGSGLGWVTAEYGMLPRATNTRSTREVTAGKASGRTSEIQRLIGRSLRAVTDLSLLGERTIWLDCDVIQADGGTRTAAVTGSFVALVLALRHLGQGWKFRRPPVSQYLAAVSVGVLRGHPILDIDFEEDSQADVDFNLVMTEAGEIVEIQGTAEEHPFPRAMLDRMLTLGEAGIAQRIAAQKDALGDKLV